MSINENNSTNENNAKSGPDADAGNWDWKNETRFELTEDVKDDSDMAELLAEATLNGPLAAMMIDAEYGHGAYFWFVTDDFRCFTVHVEEDGFNSMKRLREEASEEELIDYVKHRSKPDVTGERARQVLAERWKENWEMIAGALARCARSFAGTSSSVSSALISCFLPWWWV
jgi:hypothetical protein